MLRGHAGMLAVVIGRAAPLILNGLWFTRVWIKGFHSLKTPQPQNEGHADKLSLYLKSYTGRPVRVRALGKFWACVRVACTEAPRVGTGVDPEQRVPHKLISAHLHGVD